MKALDVLKDRARRSWLAIRAHPFISIAILPAAVLFYVLALIPFTPSIGDIKKSKQESPTVVMSVDGKELATFKRANRDWVKLSEISPLVVDALIATEDHRFYEHHGLDFSRTASALVNTISGDRQGGSTITQQLARNLYPDEVGRAPTITRKIKEAITALKIEAIYTKPEILETYLNTVSFLYNAYGIEMAARTYYDKPAKKLDTVEAATLVGMLKGTSYYNPVLNPERSLDRRNVVLAQLVKHNKLEPAKFEEMKRQPLGIDFEKQPEVTGPAAHIARQLRLWLNEWADRNGYNIYSDGLVVRTSIDSRLQAYANEAVKKQGEKLQPLADARRNAVHTNTALVQAFIRDTQQYKALREGGKSDAEAVALLDKDTAFMKSMWEAKTRLEAGFLAMEPNTGYIRAWVGSRDFNEDQFDHVQQARRQPGSTFKAFVYGAAFEAGMTPQDQLMDSPVAIQVDKNQVWRPTDVDPPTNQPMTLRDAIAQSKNTITAQVLQRVGPSRVAQLAQAMGVRQSKLEAVPSIALGSSPVTLKEMVTAYSTIANSGGYVEPALVMRIEKRSGEVLEEFHTAAPQQALGQEAAHALLDVLRTAIDKGTGIRIRVGYNIKADVAGKTGTTQNDTDGWFLLMHPQLVAGAWVGFNDPRITMIHEWGQGARSALPIVGEVFQRALQAKVLDEGMQFAAPRNIGLQDPSLLGRVNDWFGSLFGSGSAAPPPMSDVAATPTVPLPELPARSPDASIAMPSTMGADTSSSATGSATAGTPPAIFGSGTPAMQGPAGSATAPAVSGLPPARSSTIPGSTNTQSYSGGSTYTLPSGSSSMSSSSTSSSSSSSSSTSSSVSSQTASPSTRVITVPSGSGSSSGSASGGSISSSSPPAMVTTPSAPAPSGNLTILGSPPSSSSSSSSSDRPTPSTGSATIVVRPPPQDSPSGSGSSSAPTEATGSPNAKE